MKLDDRTVAALLEFVPEHDLRKMRVVQSRPFRWLPVVLGMSAITFTPFVFMRSGAFRTDTARGMALIAHEAVHIGQVGKLGWTFYPRYLWRQFRSGFEHSKHAMEIPGIEVQRTVRRVLGERGGGGSW